MTLVASFTKEVNSLSAKRPLKTNGRLANLELTCFVKEATGSHWWSNHHDILLYVHVLVRDPDSMIKMSSNQCRKSHCGDQTIIRSSHLHHGIYYTSKMTSLHRICHQVLTTLLKIGSCRWNLCLIFKWVALTWLSDKAPGQQSQ